MNIKLVIPIFAFLLLIPFALHNSFAQYSAGGVNLDGSWYVGEGLEIGDYFVYEMCYIDYLDCSKFTMAFWIEKEIRVGTEDKYLAQVLVKDGKKIIKGNMELGKIAPEPTGGSPEISPYRSAYKSSIAWLSAYATQEIGDLTGKGPKDFRAASWGKIANIGGEQILPTAIETITTPADTFDTVLIQWKTGGAKSDVWVVDDFPFPVKALTYVHVSGGVPPVAYQYELLDYKYYVTSNPFDKIEATVSKQAALGCPENYQKTKFREATNTFSMIVKGAYGPQTVKQGCEIEWFIDFKRMVNPTEFVNEVHYDIRIFDQDGNMLRSIADEEGRPELYTTAGQTHRFVIADDPLGKYQYAVWVFGTGPEVMLGGDSSQQGLIVLDVNVVKGEQSSVSPQSSVISTEIPEWIKNNAAWWADGQIDDASFVTGIQYLINKKIMMIPETSQGYGGSDEIPGWIKNNAAWWADGQIDDNTFVQGIQFLITSGIMKIS